MQAVVVAGAPFEVTELVLTTIRSADLLIAADSGAIPLLAMEIRPHAVIGDMDSIGEDALRRLRAEGVEVQEHPAQKDFTDTHLALLEALRQGADDIALIGAMGGNRPDHGIANLLLLANDAFAGVRLRLVEGRSVAHVVRAALELEGRPGSYVSLIPLTGAVTGIETEGLRYPLGGSTLRRGESRGVSNELIAPRARVAVGSGVLLVVQNFGG